MADVKMPIRERLAEQRRDTGVKQGDIGQKVGIKQATVSAYEREPSRIAERGIAFAYQFFRAYELNDTEAKSLVRQLFPEEISMLSDLFEPREDYSRAYPFEQREVPLYAANAGRPHSYLVPKECYRPTTVAYQLEGDSMSTGAPSSLEHGDYVLADTSLKSVKDGKVYVLEIIGDGYTVKRAKRINGDWFFLSDNPKYDALRPSEVNVVGEVYDAFGRKNLRWLE